ncbi:MAG TPA: glycosyltransferase family 39 protein [Thermoanaerobaculia bacterium]|nr:glycosyltransferase family 39 protein [Thermoanaerobaculia bacterium]
MTEEKIPILGARAAVLMFLLAFAVRLAAIAAVGFQTLRFGDARAYLFAAQALVRTGHYPLATEPSHFRAPGYPVFLVAATLGHPDRIAFAKIANAALGALAVLILADLSARIFRRRGLALATGVVAAVHPGFVFLSTDIQSEPLFLFLLLSAGWLLLVSADRPSSNMALLAGAASGFAALTRPSALALAPLLAAPLFDRRYPLRARGHLAGSALLGFLSVLAPWVLRNAVVYRELVPINDAGGSAFYQGNSDWMVRFYHLKNFEEYKTWNEAASADLDRQTRTIEAAAPRSPSAKSRYFVRKTFEERRGDPAVWFRLLLRKAWDWLRPYPSPLFWPAWAVWSVGAFYSALTLLAVVGLVRAPRPGVRSFSLVFLAMTMTAHVVIIVVWRYRIPYWDPVLLLYAVPGAARLRRASPAAGQPEAGHSPEQVN